MSPNLVFDFVWVRAALSSVTNKSPIPSFPCLQRWKFNSYWLMINWSHSQMARGFPPAAIQVPRCLHQPLEQESAEHSPHDTATHCGWCVVSAHCPSTATWTNTRHGDHNQKCLKISLSGPLRKSVPPLPSPQLGNHFSLWVPSQTQVAPVDISLARPGHMAPAKLERAWKM